MPAVENKIISHNCKQLQKALVNAVRNSWMKETQFCVEKNPYQTEIHKIQK